MALARSNSSKKDLHVVWDEDNLKANEEIQKDYSQVKIQEPKTPYRPPLPADSLEDEMKPLQLDDEVTHAFEQERQTAFDYVMSNGGAAFDGAGPSQPPQAAAAAATSHASSEADGDKDMQDAVGDKRSEPCNSFTSSGSEGSADKRRRFELMRRQHYNMRDALVKAKQLLASEDEEDHPARHSPSDGDEDDEDDTAGHLGNGTSTGNPSKQQEQQQHGTDQPPCSSAEAQQRQQPSQQDQDGRQQVQGATAAACSTAEQKTGGHIS